MLADLVDGGAIGLAAASFLAAAMERRASVLVVARAGGAGKTTLLTALHPFLPAGTRRLYPRGQFESFAFLQEEGLDPSTAAVLANEIGPHLPQYLWGEGVSRFLSLRERGFCLAATAHAGGVEEMAGLLAGPPLRLPAPSLAAFDLLVAMADQAPPEISLRPVESVWALGTGPRGALRYRAVSSGQSPAGEIVAALGERDQPNALIAGIGAADLARTEEEVMRRPAPQRPPDRPGAMLAKREQALRSRPNSP